MPQPLSIHDLLSISEMPTADEISLQTIAMFYEEHLCYRQFYYDIRHEQRELRLRFKPSDLIHLLGIHKIKKIRGADGINLLKSGEITFETLRASNIGAYEDIEYRMLYFPFVYQLVQNPRLVGTDQQHRNSLIKAQFIMFDGYNSRYIELKLRRESEGNPNFFVPVSFSEARKHPGRIEITIANKSIISYDDGFIHQ